MRVGFRLERFHPLCAALYGFPHFFPVAFSRGRRRARSEEAGGTAKFGGRKSQPLHSTRCSTYYAGLREIRKRPRRFTCSENKEVTATELVCFTNCSRCLSKVVHGRPPDLLCNIIITNHTCYTSFAEQTFADELRSDAPCLSYGSLRGGAHSPFPPEDQTSPPPPTRTIEPPRRQIDYKDRDSQSLLATAEEVPKATWKLLKAKRFAGRGRKRGPKGANYWQKGSLLCRMRKAGRKGGLHVVREEGKREREGVVWLFAL